MLFRFTWRVAVLVGVLLPAVCRAADEAKSYPVKMERPSRVGDRTKVDVIAAYRNRMEVQTGDEKPKNVDETIGLQIEGTCEVKEVSKDGRRTKIKFTVKECTLVIGDKKKPLLDEGDIIEARWDKDQTRYSVDGKDIPEELTEAFDLALELNDPKSATDDQVFRTDKPHKIGDVWSIDPAIAKKELERIGINTKEEELWGESTLEQSTKVDDRPCLKVKTSFKAKNITGPGRHPEEKMNLDGGTMAVESTLLLPLDEKQQPAKEDVKITTTGQLSGKNEEGKPVRVARLSERVIERTTGPVEK